MRGKVYRLGLLVALLTIAFYSLRGDTTVPKSVIESLKLLKKPIEALLPDLEEEPTQVDVEAPLNLDSYQDLHGGSERWNEMRTLIEAGKPLYGPLPSEVALSTSTTGRLAPAVPPPPGFTVQLPYESRLTVSGRKVIGLDYKSTTFTNTTFATQQGIPTSQNAFELQQQLQVRINGQVGRKVTVNVDFDDTKTDKKDISIVYKGDPDEVIQRAAFGDITLSLPQTEFAGYNKQIFGAEAELKYKALHGYVIGSRTKGQTETKEFVGNVILQRIDVPDISYVRHRFYDITQLTGSAADKVDPTTLKIFLDNRDVTRPPNGITLPNTAVDPTLLSGATDYTGNFVQLSAGIDFSFDPTFGIITFRNTLLANAVVAIDYVPVGAAQPISQTRGRIGQFKMIKFDETVILQIPKTEDLTHYNIGVNKIVRDNGQGNFTLQLLDLNRNNVSSQVGVTYLPNNSGNIFVDFEAGAFNLQNHVRLDTQNTTFSDVYANTPVHRFTFFVEFRSRVKTYTLRPNIVLNSERISLNGRVLTRDVDYFIDYESGFITFFNEDQITEESHLQATYDFSPFGIAGAQQDTLVGERTELSMYPIAPMLSQSLLGSTVLYDFAPKQTGAPDIRQTSGSFLLTEADVHFKDLVFSPVPFLKSSFTAEGARSARNPNTNGEALIENFEGTKDETTVGLSVLNWQVSATPSQPPNCTAPTGCGAFFNALAGNLGNETLRVLDINPNASALPGDQQQVLDVGYDLTRSTEASIATVLSPSGVDFSKKLFLEMFVFGDGSNAAGSPTGTQLDVTIGQISEDADSTHGGGFTDTFGVQANHPLGDGTPRTEDRNHNNTLDVGEDVGWTYFNPDGSQVAVGANNLHLDTEDLDRNGILNPVDPTVGGDVGYGSTVSTFSVTGASGLNTVDFSGWQFIRVPLNISSATAQNWTAIKEIRISLRAGAGGKRGTIKIGKVSVVGNKWLAESPNVVGSTVTVGAISNETDTNFFSPAGNPDFDSLNQVNTAISGPQPNKKRDTALDINYAFLAGIAGSSVTAKSVTVSPMDFTSYTNIRFFVLRNQPTGAGNGAVLFFRAGSDTDFLEFDVPLDNIPSGGWQEIRIKQTDVNHSQRPSRWDVDPFDPPGVSTGIQGNPNLASVSQMKFGIRTNNSSATSGEVWIDDIFAADVITRIGYAAKLQSDFEVLGWAKFGGSVRDTDHNFETFTSPITNQDRHEELGYLNLTRLAYFPMTFQARKTRTETPNIQTINNASLVSVLQTGRVDDRFYAWAGTLQFPLWPKLGLLYDTDDTATADLFRDDKTVHYGGTLDYILPQQSKFLPKTLSLGYKRTNYKLGFAPDALVGASDPFQVSNTRDYTNDYSARASFQPITGFTFNPNWSRSTTHEFKDAIVDSTTLTTSPFDYDKIKSQTVGFDGVMAFRRWLAPRVRYTVNNRETFGIPLSTNQTASLFKNVDRTDTGEVGWDFAWRDFSTGARPLQSLNVSSSYLIEDGDSWNNVAAGYNTLNFLTVRKALAPGNAEATRQQLTLRDTFRSTQRWNPFDWATFFSGPALPLRTLSLTSTLTNTNQRQETTGTPSRILTHIYPDLIMSMTQTENFFHLQQYMSNSQLNLKTQFKTVDTLNTSLEKATSNGGDWRFTLVRKLDIFVTYTRTTDKVFDEINQVTSNDAFTETFGTQVGFNLGRWRLTPKYDQSRQQALDSSGRPTVDLTTRTPALQVFADLFLPEGLKLPFGDIIVFSNRIRTTSTLSLTQKRSSLNEIQNNSDTYTLQTSEDYELTSNIRLTVGGSYSYQVNKISSDANFYSFDFNSLLTIQF